MAINKKLITFETLTLFQGANGLNSTNLNINKPAKNSKGEYLINNIPYSSIVFIKDTGQIWTHGKYFNCSANSLGLSNYVTLTGDLTINGNKTFSSSVSIDNLTAGNLIVLGSSSFINTINGNILSADKVNKDLVILLNGGTNEGTNKFTFNGSTSKSLNITPSSIGALPSGSYMTTSHPANGITSNNITNWNNVFKWYLSASDSNTDLYINNWNEIKNFLTHITDTLTLDGILEGYVTKGTSQTITGAKTFSQAINGDILGNATTSDRWKNSKNFTIGNKTISIDGSTNYTWSLSDIGAAPNISGGYLPLSAGENYPLTNRLYFKNTWKSGKNSYGEITASIGFHKTFYHSGEFDKKYDILHIYNSDDLFIESPQGVSINALKGIYKSSNGSGYSDNLLILSPIDMNEHGIKNVGDLHTNSLDAEAILSYQISVNSISLNYLICKDSYITSSSLYLRYNHILFDGDTYISPNHISTSYFDSYSIESYEIRSTKVKPLADSTGLIGNNKKHYSQGFFDKISHGVKVNGSYPQTITEKDLAYWDTTNLKWIIPDTVTVTATSMPWTSLTGTAPNISIFNNDSRYWSPSGGVWNPGANITLNTTANNQEWSFDINRNGKTGCYWHVWDSALSTMLKVNADDGKVSAPYGFVGDITGTSSKASLLIDNSTTTYSTRSILTYSGIIKVGTSIDRKWQSPWGGYASTTGDSIKEDYGHILRFNWSATYYTDFFVDANTTDLAWRRVDNSKNRGWRRILDTNNYSSYSVSLTTEQTISGNKTFTGNTTFSGSSTTMDSLTTGNLMVQGTSSISTVTSGTWLGTPIADSYIASASTWSGKLNLVTKMGSTTKPVYISANGTFSECNSYPTKTSWNYDDVYLKLSGGKLTGDLTLYTETSGDSPSLIFLRLELNQTSYFDWRIYDTGGILKFQISKGNGWEDYVSFTGAESEIVANKFTGNLNGNATTATNVAWSGLTGNVPNISIFNNNSGYITSSSNITGTAAGITGYSFKTLSAVNTSGWTNNTTDDKIIPTMSFIAYWNGAYSGNSSNITKVGTISSGKWQGTAITDTYISSASNWNSAYDWYQLMTTGNTDGVINKWKEIEAFLANISDTLTLNGILNGYVTLGTSLTITGAKTFSLAINADILGNATTADRLKNVITINGVSFDGSANITITANPNSHTHNYAASQSAGGSADYVRWEAANTNVNRRIPFAWGDNIETTDSRVRLTYDNDFQYNPSTNVLTVGSITGKAATATTLQTSRSLWGNSFNGSADISGNITISTSQAGIGNATLTLKNKNTTDNKTSISYISAYYANENGANLVINPVGNLFIGSGESASNMYALKTTDTGEVSYIMSDKEMNLYTNCLTIANRVGIVIDTSGNILPRKAETINNNVQNIGASTNKFNTIYATTFSGNASTASNCNYSGTTTKHTFVVKRTDTNGGAFITYYPNNQETTHWRVGSLQDGSLFIFIKNDASIAYIDSSGNYSGNSATANRLTTYSFNSNNTNKYRLIGLQVVSGGWNNKAIVLSIASRHSGVGIYTIHYGSECSAGYYIDRDASATNDSYYNNNKYCSIRYFGNSDDLSENKILCYFKPAAGDKPRSGTFSFFLHSSDGSNPNINILSSWGNPFALNTNTDTYLMSSVDEATYGTILANTLLNVADSCIGNSATATGLSSIIANNKLPTRLLEYRTTGVTDENLTVSGFYYMNTSASPFVGTDWTSRNDHMLTVNSYSTSWSNQIALNFYAPELFIRNKNNGTWSAWTGILISKYTLTGTMKESTYNRGFKKCGGNNSWDAQVYSRDGYLNGCFVSFKAGSTSNAIMVGLNSDPTIDANYASIDYCWYLQNGSDKALSIYESGSNIGSISGHTTYNIGDELRVEYVGGYIRYYHNGILCRSIARSISSKLYMDSSFHGNAGYIYDVNFGPSAIRTEHAISADSCIGNSASASKLYVNLHIGNNTNYPILWTNTTGTTVGNTEVYKSGNNLYFNTSTLKLTASGGFNSGGNSYFGLAEIDSLTVGNLVVQGTSSLNTITSGTWNGSVITSTYLPSDTIYGTLGATDSGTTRYLRKDSNGNLYINQRNDIQTLPTGNKTAHLYIGPSGNTNTTASTTNGNTYIKLYEDSTAKESYKITGGTGITVTNDASGNITITNTISNTWRGIQNNLTSTSTTDSLSAYQGKLLNDKFANYLALTGGTVTGATTFSQAINADILGNATTADRLKNDVSGTAGSDWQPCKIENGVIKYYNNQYTIPTKASWNYDDVYLKLDGGTITGNITFNGTDIKLKTSSSSSNDSGDIIWYYGNGNEKMRLWANDTYTSEEGIKYRVFKSDGTKIYEGTLATLNQVVTKSGEQTITGNKTFNSTVSIDSLTSGNLTVQGTSSLGTVTSGTWNGSTITSAYLPKATNSGIGCIKLSAAADSTAATLGASTGNTDTGNNRNYPVKLDSNGVAYVYIPWKNNTYTIPSSLPANGGNADTVDSLHASTSKLNSSWYSRIPAIDGSGVIELGTYMDFHDSGTDSKDYAFRLTAGNGTLTGSGSFYANSDIRYKNILEYKHYTVENFSNLKVFNYTWKDLNKIQIGTSAQDVEKIIPELVTENEGIKSLDYAKLGAIGVIELSKEIVRLRKRIKELENLWQH